MTGRELAERLVRQGLDAAELAAKTSLIDLVVARFDHRSQTPGARRLGGADSETAAARRFSGASQSPKIAIWWVPGRLEVFGKHTDYAGGRTLVAAVPRGFVLAAAPRDDGVIQVVDARRGESVTLRADPRDAEQHGGWRHYVEVVAHRLARNFPGSAIGADVVFASDLPRASGMSSSSALVVGLAAALVRIGGIETRHEWQTNIADRLGVAAYYACIENGRSFGTLAGHVGVGTHGGSEDHAAILTAAPGYLSAFSFVPMRPLDRVEVPEAWRFVLAPCGVAAEKTGAALGPYNRLSRGAQVLLELWNADGPAAASLGLALRSEGQCAGSAAGRLRDLVRRSSIDGWTPDALERRLEHFIREDARVPEAIEAFRVGDAARLGELSLQSQVDAERLLGNQITETIALAHRARECGAFAACSFGAGFGGSVWALVHRDQARGFADAWHPAAFVADPSLPLTEL